MFGFFLFHFFCVVLIWRCVKKYWKEHSLPQAFVKSETGFERTKKGATKANKYVCACICMCVDALSSALKHFPFAIYVKCTQIPCITVLQWRLLSFVVIVFVVFAHCFHLFLRLYSFTTLQVTCRKQLFIKSMFYSKKSGKNQGKNKRKIVLVILWPQAVSWVQLTLCGGNKNKVKKYYFLRRPSSMQQMEGGEMFWFGYKKGTNVSMRGK